MKIGVLAVGCLAATAAHAQSGAGFFNPLSASQNGIHLYSVSVNGGYFTGGVPYGITGGSVAVPSGALATTGASANFGWGRSNDRSNLSASYAVSYMAFPSQTELNGASHSFGMNWGRKLAQHWSVSMGTSGQISNQQQNYFSANSFGLAASLPTTFEGLAAAMLTGAMTDPQLAAVLTGSLARSLPEDTYLYGRRFGSGSAHAGLSYSPSGRSSFQLAVSASRAQGLDSGRTSGNASVALIPQTTSGAASLAWGYSLTPRTHIGIELSSARTFSELQAAYGSTAGLSMGRTMSESWFLQGHVGAGSTIYTKQTGNPATGPQIVAGAGMGYKSRAHTMLASVERSLGDSYGLESASSDSASLGWALKAPGSRWSLSANFGYQRTNGSPLYQAKSWRVTGGLARALSSHVFFSLQYAYFTLPSKITSAAAESLNNQSGVTVGMTWSPSSYR